MLQQAHKESTTIMMDAETFDEKLNELREIKNRMQNYDHNTPMSQVVTEQERAQELYDQLIETISSFRV